jgi:hypothetical protein
MIEVLKISFIAFMFSSLTEKGMIFEIYGNLISWLPNWLCKPLGGCAMCFSGQVCLWYFIFTKSFDFIDLAFFVSVGIFSSLVFSVVWKILRAICKL